MKKFFLFGAICLAMASCSSEEEIYSPDSPRQEIALSAGYVQKASSRAPLEEPKLPEDGSFNMMVTARYQRPKDYLGEKNYESFFEGQTFKCETHDAGWSAGWYYPFDGKMQFLAYAYPNKANMPDWQGKDFNTGKVVTLTPSVTAQWDYLDADKDGRKKGEIEKLVLTVTDFDGNHDLVYGSLLNVDCPPASRQTMSFNHAFALLQFYADAEGFPGVIEIDKIEVVDVIRRGGLLSVTAGDPSTAEWIWQSSENPDAPLYEDYEEEKVAVFPGSNTHPLTLVNQKGDMALDHGLFGNLLICPREQRSGIIIYYKIKNNGHSSSTESYKTYIDLSGYDEVHQEGGQWKMGNRYQYWLHFTPTAITYDTTVQEYSDDDFSGELHIPDDNETSPY